MKKVTLQLDEWDDLLYIVTEAAKTESSAVYLLDKLLNSDVVYIDRPIPGSETDDIISI